MGGLGGEEDLGGLVCRALGELDDVEVSAAVAAASEGAVEAHLSFFFFLSLFCFKNKKRTAALSQGTERDCGMAEQRIVAGFGCGSSGPLTRARIQSVTRDTKRGDLTGNSAEDAVRGL